MHKVRRAARYCALAICLSAGCKPVAIDDRNPLPLEPLRFAPESVELDSVSLRVPIDDPVVNGELWNEISEQHFPSDVRQRLHDNGIRAGVIGAKIPLTLERLLQMEERAPASTDQEREVDLARQPLIQQGALRLGPGSPGRVYASGQQSKHQQLHVFRGLVGHTYRDAACVFTVRTTQLVDGYVKLELVPEIEQGESVAQRVARPGGFEMEMRPPTERFEDLRIEVALAPGEMLALTSWPQHKGRLGSHFFNEKVGGDSYQKLLLIRIAQTKGDSLFEPE